MFGARFRCGPGTAIVGGLFLALFSVWATGSDPRPGAHLIAVFLARSLLILLALSSHEWAHGAMAYLLGDRTAKDAGRLTLDPRAHFDAVGLLVVPGLLTALHAPFVFGWAKPVPVDFDKLRNPRWGTALVAAAGPAMNLIAALVVGSFLRILGVNGATSLVGSLAWTFVVANFFIGVFNLLPLYPMDGGRIVSCFLPSGIRYWLSRNERKAFLATVMLLVVAPTSLSVTGLNLSPVGPLADILTYGSAFLTGDTTGAWFHPVQAWLHLR